MKPADYVLLFLAIAIILMALLPLHTAFYILGVIIAVSSLTIALVYIPRQWTQN